MLEEDTILKGKNLFILYLVISSNFLANLFGCKIQKAFNENMLLKHLLGFFTLYFFISLTESSSSVESDLTSRLKFAAFIYIWFILSTRVDIRFWTVLITMLGIVYLLQLNKDIESKKQNPDNEKIEKYNKYQDILIKLAFIVTVVGFFVYLGAKKYEYGSKFNYTTFITGNVSCKGNSFSGEKSLTIMDSIKKAFK
jgi:hypothetical protein